MALKGTPIVTKHTPADLKNYLYGDQVGTTSLTYINNQIQPTQQPKVFDTLNDVKQALETHRIAALVTDTPTAQFISSAQISTRSWSPSSRAPASTTGCCSTKGNPLVTCVNKAIATLKSNGTLQQLQKKYLQIYLTFPTIQP